MTGNNVWSVAEVVLDESCAASPGLAAALHPSTSKDYVPPRDYQSLLDNEVLHKLLKLEKMQSVDSAYFVKIQTEITTNMRSMLVDWMSEVCEEEQCSRDVFALAVGFVDRFLSVEAVHKRQLQVLATACLFLAGKVKEIRPFSGSRLVQFTDESVTLSELLSWEMLVLNRLQWNLSSLTAHDFIDQYVHRLRLPSPFVCRLRPLIDRLLTIASLDFRLAVLPPSVIAVCCLHTVIAFALGGIETHSVSQLHSDIQTDMSTVLPYVNIMLAALMNETKTEKFWLYQASSIDCRRSCFVGDLIFTKSETAAVGSTTPTDVEDVTFL